jgi:hypothetical protein
MILIEEKFNDVAPLEEASPDGKKKIFLKGVFAEAEQPNQNGRTYALAEMTSEVKRINDQAQVGRFVLGELDHPSSLDIKLENVSHKIVEMWMEGNNAYGKAEIIAGHPKGQILKSLIDSGINVGVSTRGSGQVNESTGRVANFKMITVDAVATPSARSAYPETIQEQIDYYARGNIVTDLAEANIHDPKAQKYFQEEMRKFINAIGLR